MNQPAHRLLDLSSLEIVELCTRARCGENDAWDQLIRQYGAITGDTEWTRYEIVLDVPEVATLIAFGVLISGPGDVWIDDLAFDVVDTSVPTTGAQQQPSWEPANLDFEK